MDCLSFVVFRRQSRNADSLLLTVIERTRSTLQKLIDSGRNDGELKRENHERVSFGFSDDEEEDFSEGGNTSEAGDMDVDD